MDEKGRSLIHLIFSNSGRTTEYFFLPLLQKILKNGANPNLLDSELQSPLFLATDRINLALVSYCVAWNRKVVSNGGHLRLFDFNIKNLKEGKTVLHHSCSKPSLSLIAELSKDINLKSFILNNFMMLPRQQVPKSYLTSKKMIWGLERVQLIIYFQSTF